jgi:ferrochelatase
MRIGILLTNLGTPDGCDTASVRRYLKEFLSDSRVVEIPRLLWWGILHGIILPFRSPKSAAKYAQIWTPSGSPLMLHSKQQAEALSMALQNKLGQMQLPSDLIHVQLAMRYGNPSIASGLEALREAGCQKILSVPLYPQYAASTTASVNDAIFNVLKTWRWQPALRTLNSYHDFPPYINALARRIQDDWTIHGKGDVLVMSFHGIPRFALDKGDPYYCLCQKTARMLAEKLGLASHEYKVSFQSRFGRTEWLQPYTTQVLEELGKNHTSRVDVICPGFTSDCLETLEEIAMEGKSDFLKAGGKNYHYIPALNEHPAWIEALSELCIQELGNWLTTPRPIPAELEQTQQRARQLGAKQ